jgi:hypothetical protein
VLEQIERQISQVKEEAFSRIEILENVEKWLSACDEESWLEEYSRVSFFLSSSYIKFWTLLISNAWCICTVELVVKFNVYVTEQCKWIPTPIGHIYHCTVY